MICFFNHEKTDLVCIEDGTVKHLCWNLLMYKNDATKLNVAIDNAIDEYEVIMRDLYTLKNPTSDSAD